jgi:hypothetical protein
MNNHERNQAQLEILAHVRDWQNSELSQIEYCQEQGISFSKFNYWVRKSRPDSAPSHGFVPINLKASPAGFSASPLKELVTADGSRLSFYSPVEPEFTKRILY